MAVSRITEIEIPNILRFLPGLNIFLQPDAPRFTILEINDAYTAASGTKREELLGRGIFEVFPNQPGAFHPDLETALKASLLKVIAEKIPHEMPVLRYDILNKETGNLEERFWLPKNTPILDEEGNITYIMHSVADITSSILLEQKVKKSEALLEKSQKHYYSLFKQNPNAVFSLDLEGNFLSANDALGALAECSQEEIYHMSFITFVAPEDLKKTLFYFNEATKGKPQQYEVGMITAKGNKRIVYVTILPIVIDNKVEAVYGIAKDITEKIKNQKELQESNKRFEMVTQTTNIAIWEWDLITNKITKTGKDFYKLLGYSLTEEPANEFWISLIHPDDRERIQNRYKAEFESPNTHFLEDTYRIQREDKSYAYINDRFIISRNDQGQATHIFGVTNDISYIKKFEAERESLIKELTQINLDLKQFSYITSHNLRTPIANLIGLGKLIDETKIEDPMTRMLLEKYKQTTVKLNENVNDLLEILIIKNNQEIPVKEVQLDVVFQQVADSVGTYITQSGAQIYTDFSAGNMVNFNPGYLHSIFLNLLTNAIKYRSPDRKLHIEIQTENRHGHLFLHFSDNGLGIDLKKYGDRIFGLYQKFHDHPESKGLGLHIVASQVKAMGGEITLKSELNIGTTFTIQFN